MGRAFFTIQRSVLFLLVRLTTEHDINQSHVIHIGCMSKSNNENWHLLVIWIVIVIVFGLGFSRSHLSTSYAHKAYWIFNGGWIDVIWCAQYCFCRTSFLLISISLETTSALMCQFPYFTRARIAWQIKIDQIHQFVCVYHSGVANIPKLPSTMSFEFYYHAKLRIHRGIKTIIWMPTNIDCVLYVIGEREWNGAAFVISLLDSFGKFL